MYNKKISLIITFILLLQFINFLYIQTGSADSNPNIIYVDDDYDSNTDGWNIDHFNSIQKAVDNVSENGTIYVNNGVYFENIVLNKSVDLIGENKENTIVDGKNDGHVFRIVSTGTSLSGFTIKNTSFFKNESQPFSPYNFYAGIYIKANYESENISNVKIFDNKIVDTLYGIQFENHGMTVSDIEIYDNEIIVEDIFEDITEGFSQVGADGQGIKIFFVDDVDIKNNSFTLYGPNCTAIFTTASTKIEISGNTISHLTGNNASVYGISGIIHDSEIKNNEINLQSSSSNCIYIEGNDNQIYNNTLSSNGGFLYYSEKPGGVNVIRNNFFISNGENISIFCNYEEENNSKEYFYHNNFYNLGEIELVNNYNADSDYYHTIWYQGYPSGGNYWSDYEGSDVFQGSYQDLPGGDGIGDTSVQIDLSGGAEDKYPLMHPTTSSKKQLIIDVESQILEDTSFDVTVTSENNPVYNAEVSFAGEQEYTDSEGVVTFDAPSVSSNQTFSITASKNNFYSSNGSVIVVDQTSYIGSLEIVCDSSVDESENFQIKVTCEEIPLEDVVVSFDGSTEYTDGSGFVSFAAPYVDEDVELLITAEKNNYLPKEKYVTIKNNIVTDIEIISPAGGETWSGSNPVFWNILNPPSKDYSVTLEYRINNKTWFKINESIDKNYYFWDTTKIIDSENVKVRVSVKVYDNDDGYYHETILCMDTLEDVFSVENNLKNEGWLTGYISAEGTTDPLNDTQVCVIISEAEGSVTSKCSFTDENGNYKLIVPTGVYKVKASKKGYMLETEENVEVSKSEETLLHFELNKSENAEYLESTLISENRKEIKNGILRQRIGGEVTVKPIQNRSDYEKLIYIYNGITVEELLVSDENVSLTINGDENSTGKTLVVNLEEDFFKDGKNLSISYDGKKISLADDINDVLDPNNDGSNPEYLITYGSNGTQVLVSIPHFSEHTISIFPSSDVEETVEEISKKVQQNKEIVVFIAVVVLLVAVFYMLRKGKEEDF